MGLDNVCYTLKEEALKFVCIKANLKWAVSIDRKAGNELGLRTVQATARNIRNKCSNSCCNTSASTIKEIKTMLDNLQQ